jgi:hypothetical protein
MAWISCLDPPAGCLYSARCMRVGENQKGAIVSESFWALFWRLRKKSVSCQTYRFLFYALIFFSQITLSRPQSWGQQQTSHHQGYRRNYGCKRPQPAICNFSNFTAKQIQPSFFGCPSGLTGKDCIRFMELLFCYRMWMCWKTKMLWSSWLVYWRRMCVRVKLLVILTFCRSVIGLYRVSQEERSVFWEVIVSVI